MKCQCENKAHAIRHPWICTNEAIYTWCTIYGTFAVCAECDEVHRPPTDFMKKMKCRDCSEEMSERDLDDFELCGFVPQLVDNAHEGICISCYENRMDAGESADDLIAEFCG